MSNINYDGDDVNERRKSNNQYLKEISEKIGQGGGGTVDSELSTTSENPVQNKVITLALEDKIEISDLSTVAITGDYDDLSDKPSIPSKISDLTDDSDFVKENELSTVATSGSYTDLSSKPNIPTKTSDLTNDSGFLTQHQDISGKANISDLSNVAFSGDYDDLSNKPIIPSVTVIDDISEITNNGFYILKESEPPLPQLKLVFRENTNYDYSSLSITTDQSDTENIYLADGEILTVDWGDGSVVTYSNTDTLPQEYSFTTSGEHTVIFDFSNCNIPTLGEYTFESCASNITEVYYPYGATKVFDMGLEYSYLTLVDIPITVSEYDGDLGTTNDGFVDVYWTDANDIPSISYIVSGQKVRIPTGTTAIYEANSDWNNNGNTVFIERGA